MVDRNLALETMQRAADAACDILVQEYERYYGENATATLSVKAKTAPNDVVTEVDALSQAAIISVIQSVFPDHRFLAEEEGADTLGSPDSPYRWIIDPLDGTLCFVHGKPNFGTLIALQENGETIVAVGRMPLRKTAFHAIRGGGCFINGKQVKLRETKNMHDAILCSNMVRRAKEDASGVLQISTPKCASLENYGSAVDEIGQILEGWNDGCFFKGIPQWDIAGGCLMVEEAGGKSKYTLLEPENPRSRTEYCVISTEPIFDELWEFVTQKM